MREHLVLLVCVGMAAGACKETPKAGEPIGVQPGMGTPAAEPGGLAGTVIETMDAGGYTYVRMHTATGEVWAAGPKAAVKVGDQVTTPVGSPMPQFHSKTLNRTFELIYFVGQLSVGGQPPAAPAVMGGGDAGGMGDMGGHGGGAVAAAVEVKLGDVARAAGGQTVGELFASKDMLAGKEVLVRGKVVKYNGGIMGRNWIHLRDGTGVEGTDSLTVTSTAATSVGAIVLVQGKLAVNKDFGSGYKYDLLVEEASVTAE